MLDRFSLRDRGLRAGLAVFVTAGVQLGMSAATAQTLPSDVQPRCAVPGATFASWFQSGTPAANGVVNPANGLTFPNTPNCSFYQWGAQMFLWLTSPAPSTYGGGSHIFDSPTFYDLSPPDSTGQRTMIPHTGGFIHPIAVRAAKLGPDHLPITFTRDGTPVEVQPAQTVTNGPLRLRNAAGDLVDVARVERTATGTLRLLDANSAEISPRLRQAPPAVPATATPVRPNDLSGAATSTPPGAPAAGAGQAVLPSDLAAGRIPTALSEPIRVQKFILNNIPIFVDAFGNLVQVDQEEADGSVLMAKTGSLIYYTIMVNDVYAYFLTGVKDGAIQGGAAHHTFPTAMGDLGAIQTFASAHGKTFADADALAVEVKAAWIETTGLPNPSEYVTIQAEVPTYNTSNSSQFVQTGTHTATLALVGMHVVGSVNGHPEMIWASFEHFGNAPNEAYDYLTGSGTQKTVARDTSGSWLFAATGSAGPFNVRHMVQSGSNIQASSGFTVSASDTIRWKAFGAASNLAPNPLVTPAGSNTEVVSADVSVLNQLPAGDIRKNYYMLGATWTIGGAAPTPGVPMPGSPGNQVGTSRMESTALETYDQGTGSSTVAGGSNCMTCHQSSTTSVADTFVSQVFPIVKPLF